jgi:hypothetical protein
MKEGADCRPHRASVSDTSAGEEIKKNEVVEKIRTSSRYGVQAESLKPLAVIMLNVNVIPYVSSMLCIFEDQSLDLCAETGYAEFTVLLSLFRQILD